MILSLCGKNYKENAQLARRMGYQEIANEIEEITRKTLDKPHKELRLERLLEK